MKFIPNEIWITFSKFLALLWFLIMILKTLMFDLWIFIHKIKRCFWWKIAKTVKNGCWKILKSSVMRVSRMYFLIDQGGIKNWSTQLETLWWNSSLSRSIENSFRSIECFLRLIKEESRIDQFRQKLYDEILQCLDQLRIPFNRFNVLFDWSNSNQESIEWDNDFVMYFFIFLIDWGKGLTDWRH